MIPTLLYTGIRVRDLDEALHFFCDICGMEKVGPGSDELPTSILTDLQKDVMPKLFGLEEKQVFFRSQLVGPKGNHAALYELFEWITPKWTEIIRYEPGFHVGIFRSNVITEGFDDLMRKIELYDGADFFAHEVVWQSNGPDKETLPALARMRLVRHNSGAILQVKGDMPKSYLDNTPGRITAIRHRAEHVKNFYQAADFFLDKVGCGAQGDFEESGYPHLSSANVREPFRHYLSEFAIQRLFGVDMLKYPIVENTAAYFNVLGLDGKNQNLDIFEWITPRTCGNAYPTTTHIGFQRLCFVVDNFDEVKQKMHDGTVRIVCEEVEIPEYSVPETNLKCTRAMSVYDPSGVFHIILG